MPASPFHGFLNVNKPAGLTSRRVVDHVQRLVRPGKAGHAGTLDPLATGVLVVCVGAATRLTEYVQQMPKHYTGTFLLGRQSPTEDIEGPVTELDHPPQPTQDQISAAARAMVGQIQQRPPAFSALKVAGRRAYDLARQGGQVNLEPRPITIYRLEVASYQYPDLTLDIECSSGTYVRSLGRDLAESLGTGAVMASLMRTAVGGFRIERAVSMEQLTTEHWTEYLEPMLRAVEGLPRVELSAEEAQRIRRGLTIARQSLAPEAGELAAVDGAGRLVAILSPRGPGVLGPVRNLG